MPVENWTGVTKELNAAVERHLRGDEINTLILNRLSYELGGEIFSSIMNEEGSTKQIKHRELSITKTTEEWGAIQQEINKVVIASDVHNRVEMIMLLSNQITDEIGNLIINE